MNLRGQSSNSYRKRTSDSECPAIRADCVRAALIPCLQHMNQPFPVHIDQPGVVRGRYSLRRRDTWVINAKHDGLRMKISWPEESRWNEADIVKQAMADTSRIRIRGLLGLSKDNYRDSQVSRLLVVSRLFPITALDPEPFWLRFWECYDCHYLLWRLGARHRDISPNNLMYNSDSEGILIDWDLATIADTSDASLKTERTGTMPFMPLGLLADNGRHGELKHLYRHDSESFAWVLLWTLARFENGKQILNPPFEGWSKGGYVKCRQAKKDVADLAVVAPKSCPPQIWDVVRDFAEYWMSFNLILSICPVCYEAIDQEVYSRVQEVREGKSSIRTGIDDGLRAAGMQ